MNTETYEITEKQRGQGDNLEQIINGKVYSTATATWVAGLEYEKKEIYYADDPAHIYYDDLYITHQKNWFLDRTMRDRDNNGYFMTRSLVELTPTQAMLWLSEHRLNKIAKKYFGDQLATA